MTVIVSIEFNEWAKNLWLQGVWTTPLGGLPVRWYPANWKLQQRKERERFQVVVKDIPGNITTSTLYPINDLSQSSISPLKCKAFKVVQDSNTRKLIMYFENWAKLDKVINTTFNFQEFTGI